MDLKAQEWFGLCVIAHRKGILAAPAVSSATLGGLALPHSHRGEPLVR
jgi:hypothetical protein